MSAHATGPDPGSCPACQGASLPPGMNGCLRCHLQVALLDDPAAPPNTDEELPEVPGYRLLARIGEGGMGEVYLAEQLRPVRRDVALKRLREDHDPETWLHRFQIGIEALAGIDHPHIATVHDAGVDPTGRPYFTMELVEGLPITEHCDRFRLSPEARLHLLATVCLAVHHAHRRGVLHGDLKPANILVSVDEAGRPVPKLIDFGTRRFRAGHVPCPGLGTPGFASPEQCDGSRPPDARSDVHALGRLLEVLGAADTRATELQWIIQRATALLPEQRYDSAADLANDLHRLVDGLPLAAGPDSVFYRTRTWIRKNGLRYGLTAIMLFLLLAGIGTGFVQTWRQHESEQARKHLERQAASEFHRARMTEALVHGLAAALHDADMEDRRLRVRHLLNDLQNRASELVADGLVEPAQPIHMTLGAAAAAVGDTEAARKYFTEAVRLALELPDRSGMAAFGARGALARTYLHAGQAVEAREVLEEMLRKVPEAAPSHARVVPWLDLARVHLATGDPSAAWTAATNALQEARLVDDPHHPLNLQALQIAARVLEALGRTVEAVQLLDEAIGGLESRFGPEAPETRHAQAERSRLSPPQPALQKQGL